MLRAASWARDPARSRPGQADETAPGGKVADLCGKGGWTVRTTLAPVRALRGARERSWRRLRCSGRRESRPRSPAPCSTTTSAPALTSLRGRFGHQRDALLALGAFLQDGDSHMRHIICEREMKGRSGRAELSRGDYSGWAVRQLPWAESAQLAKTDEKGTVPFFGARLLSDLRALAGWIDRNDRLRWLLLVPVVSVAAILEALGALAVFGLAAHGRRAAPRADAPVVSRSGRRGRPTIRARSWRRSRSPWPSSMSFARCFSPGPNGSRSRRCTARARAPPNDCLRATWRPTIPFTSGAGRRRSSQEVARSTDIAFQLIAASALNIFAEVATLGALVAVLLLTAPARAIAAVGIVLALVVDSGRGDAAGVGALGRRKEARGTAAACPAAESWRGQGGEDRRPRSVFREPAARHAPRAGAACGASRAWTASALRLGVETVLIVCDADRRAAGHAARRFRRRNRVAAGAVCLYADSVRCRPRIGSC